MAHRKAREFTGKVTSRAKVGGGANVYLTRHPETSEALPSPVCPRSRTLLDRTQEVKRIVADKTPAQELVYLYQLRQQQLFAVYASCNALEAPWNCPGVGCTAPCSRNTPQGRISALNGLSAPQGDSQSHPQHCNTGVTRPDPASDSAEGS